MKAEELLRRYAAEERNFQNADLRGQNFKGKDLSGADFSHADIRSTNFSRANLSNAKFTGAKACPIPPESSKLAANSYP